MQAEVQALQLQVTQGRQSHDKAVSDCKAALAERTNLQVLPATLFNGQLSNFALSVYRGGSALYLDQMAFHTLWTIQSVGSTVLARLCWPWCKVVHFATSYVAFRCVPCLHSQVAPVYAAIRFLKNRRLLVILSPAPSWSVVAD